MVELSEQINCFVVLAQYVVARIVPAVRIVLPLRVDHSDGGQTVQGLLLSIAISALLSPVLAQVTDPHAIQ